MADRRNTPFSKNDHTYPLFKITIYFSELFHYIFSHSLICLYFQLILILLLNNCSKLILRLNKFQLISLSYQLQIKSFDLIVGALMQFRKKEQSALLVSVKMNFHFSC